MSKSDNNRVWARDTANNAAVCGLALVLCALLLFQAWPRVRPHPPEGATRHVSGAVSTMFPLPALVSAPELPSPAGARGSRADDACALSPGVSPVLLRAPTGDAPLLTWYTDTPSRLPSARGFIFFAIPPPLRAA